MDLKKAKSNFNKMKAKVGIKGKNLAPGALLEAARKGFKKPVKKAIKGATKSPGFSKTAPKPKEDVYAREAKLHGLKKVKPAKPPLKKVKPVIKPAKKKPYYPGGDRTEGAIPVGR